MWLVINCGKSNIIAVHNHQVLVVNTFDGIDDEYQGPHLSKGSSGRKQKCTQFPTPLSGIAFHALSHGVIHFVQSVSFKNLEMEVSDWLLKNLNL